MSEAATALWKAPSKRVMAIGALFRDISALMMLGRDEEALARVSRPLSNSEFAEIHIAKYPNLIPDLFALRFVLLEKLGRDGAEIDAAVEATIERLEKQHERHPTTTTQEYIAALAWKTRGKLSDSAGDTERALAAFDHAIRYSCSGGDNCEEIGAEAMLARADLLERMGRRADAVIAYDAILTRFKRSRRTVLRQTIKAASQRRARLTGR